MVVYINNILEYSKILHQHVMDVSKVLLKLRKNIFYANVNKSEFGLMKMDLLMHVLDGKGIHSNLKRSQLY